MNDVIYTIRNASHGTYVYVGREEKFKIRALFYLKSKGAIAIEEKGLPRLVGWKEKF